MTGKQRGQYRRFTTFLLLQQATFIFRITFSVSLGIWNSGKPHRPKKMKAHLGLCICHHHLMVICLPSNATHIRNFFQSLLTWTRVTLQASLSLPFCLEPLSGLKFDYDLQALVRITSTISKDIAIPLWVSLKESKDCSYLWAPSQEAIWQTALAGTLY